MPFIQLSKSNRASCRKSGCKQNIQKDSYRIGVRVSTGRWTSTHWYHLLCYAKANGVQRPATTSGLSGFSELPFSEKEELRKALWPMQVCEADQPKLKLLKPFNKMTVKDLKSELQRRDLPYSGTKPKLKNRLEQYLNTPECKNANKMLVFGYCRESERDYKLLIPVYLHRIVLNYFPPCL